MRLVRTQQWGTGKKVGGETPTTLPVQVTNGPSVDQLDWLKDQDLDFNLDASEASGEETLVTNCRKQSGDHWTRSNQVVEAVSADASGASENG